MLNIFWIMIAKLVSRKTIATWLIGRAKSNPYFHITGPDGDVYMERYWLFNPFPDDSSENRRWWHFSISIRIHHILRADTDRHLHDHPWNARTIILSGEYEEIRLERQYGAVGHVDAIEAEYVRRPGDAAKLSYGEYHRIARVSEGGVWTLFISGKHRGTWGFLVDGFKVPWRQYLQVQEPRDTSREGA